MNKTIEERAKDTRPVLIVIENGILIHVGDPLHFHEETLIGYARSGKTIMTITNDDFKQNYKLYGPVPIAGAAEAQDDWKRVEDEMRSLLKYIGEKGYYVNDDGSVWKDAFLYGKEIDVVAEYRNLPSPPSNDKP